jgi:hypothetical protein
MRSIVFLGHPTKDFLANKNAAMKSGRSWQQQHLGTNLIWLYFILHELIDGAWKNNGEFESKGNVKRSSTEKEALEKKRTDLYWRLRLLLQQLSPASWKTSDLSSARDVVALALEKEWLDEADVRGADGSEHEMLERLREVRLED